MLLSRSGAYFECPRLASSLKQSSGDMVTCPLLCFALTVTALIASSPMRRWTNTVHVLRYSREKEGSYDIFSEFQPSQPETLRAN